METNKMLYNIPFNDYLKMDGVSQSELKSLAKCPRNYQYIKDNPVETDAMKFGSALHSYLLENDKFNDEYFRTKKITRSGAKWKAVLEEAGEKKVLFDAEYEKIVDMEKSVRKNPYFISSINNSQKEVSIFWKDEEVGVDCKGRIDGIINMKDKNDTIILFDLKTTKNCEEQAFGKDFVNLKYHLQLAYYMDGYKKVTGITPPSFIIIAIEKKAPFLSTNYEIPYNSPVIEAGRKEYKKLLNKYKACKIKNDFDVGLENDLNTIDSMPAWYNFKNNEEEE